MMMMMVVAVIVGLVVPEVAMVVAVEIVSRKCNHHKTI